MREPGFYWVKWKDGEGEFVAEWHRYEPGLEQTVVIRPYWWNIAGSDDSADDDELVVLSERLVPPSER